MLYAACICLVRERAERRRKMDELVQTIDLVNAALLLTLNIVLTVRFTQWENRFSDLYDELKRRSEEDNP